MLSFTTTLLFGISYYNENLNDGKKLFLAKTNANECAIIIDSFFSNSASEYNIEFPCSGKENITISKQNSFEEKTFLITEIKKEKILEVKINEHYK